MSTNPESKPDRRIADATDAADLLPLVYQELRRLAQHRIQNERQPQSLTATALVHEAYLRISEGCGEIQWANQRHFFGAAAEAMRRILIDRARARKQLKRGGDRQRVDFEESRILAPAKDEELLRIDEALQQLSEEDSESAELVKLRYFAGMTWEEISRVTGTPERTLRRRWTYARSWLQERVRRD